jgi:prepilin-type processing-associated H-X9-DG protein
MALGDQLYANGENDWHVPIINGLAKDEHWFRNPLFMKLVAMKGRSNTEKEQGYNAMTLPKEYKCPSDKRTVGKGLYGSTTSGSNIEGTSYGINGGSLYSAGHAGPGSEGWHYSNNSNPPPMAHCLRVLQVQRPTDKFFMMDSVWYVVNWLDADYKLVWDVAGDVMGAKGRDGVVHWDPPSYRHSEGLNMVFYDWHSKYLKKQQVWQYAATTGQTRILNGNSWMPIHGKQYIDEDPAW